MEFPSLAGRSSPGVWAGAEFYRQHFDPPGYEDRWIVVYTIIERDLIFSMSPAQD